MTSSESRSASPHDRPRPFFSRYYAAVSGPMEAEGMADLRAELLAPLHGEIVEIGAGNGRNFPHYPQGVHRVSAIEPEPRLRALAEQAAAVAAADVRVWPGRAEQLPLADHSMDGAVFCLVLCALPDPGRALAEVARVLRPGGVVRFLEHVEAESAGLRLVQRVADATVWPALTGGCRTATDPLGSLHRAGFDVLDHRRLRFPEHRFTQPASPHVLGTARRPNSSTA